MSTPTGLRPEYKAALTLIAAAVRRLRGAGHSWPVIVGGAAVEFFTGGAVTSGDFDLWTSSEGALERELLAVGFSGKSGAADCCGATFTRIMTLGSKSSAAGSSMDAPTSREWCSWDASWKIRAGTSTSHGWRRSLPVTLRRTTLEEQEQRIGARLTALGIASLDVPANSGARRTPEKRALLQAIADNARAQGREPAFAAKFQPPD